MKRSTKTGLIILILLLAIGFASIATTLIINGTALIGSNTNDFRVIFTSASTDRGGTVEISENLTEITFSTKVLKTVGDVAVLNYVVTNDSANYDANVTVNWEVTDVVNGKDYSSYYEVSRTGFDTDAATLVEAKASQNGTIQITLVKPVVEDAQLSFTMTFDASAVERTETAVASSTYEIVSGDLDTVGSVVKIADEEFYVIGQEDADHVKLLSKYNLNVGENLQPGTEGLQNPLSVGWNSDESTKVNNVYPGAVPFNTNGQYYLDSENSKIYDEYGGYIFKNNQYYDNDDNLVYPYIYTNKFTDGDYVVNIARYVEDYVAYLNSQGAITSGRLLTYEEMSELACNGSGSACVGEDWVSNISYYTGNLRASDLVWVVYSSHQYGDNGYAARYSLMLGVRPVIILKK